MNYGKLVKGELHIAGAVIMTGGREYYNPSDKLKIEMGFKPIIETEYPVKAGSYFTAAWQDNGKEIVKTWTEHALSEPEPDLLMKRISDLEAEVLSLKAVQLEQAAKFVAIDSIKTSGVVSK